MNDVDTCHGFEQLSGQMRSAAIARRGKVEFAWMRLGVGNELGNCLGWNGRTHRHDGGHAGDAGDRRNVADKIEIELVEERGVDRRLRVDQEQRVAVRG
jgi:hypothetical protein